MGSLGTASRESPHTAVKSQCSQKEKGKNLQKPKPLPNPPKISTLKKMLFQWATHTTPLTHIIHPSTARIGYPVRTQDWQQVQSREEKRPGPQIATPHPYPPARLYISMVKRKSPHQCPQPPPLHSPLYDVLAFITSGSSQFMQLRGGSPFQAADT